MHIATPLAKDPVTGSEFRVLADQLLVRPGTGGAASDEFMMLIWGRCHLALGHVLEAGIHASREALRVDMAGLPRPANELASSELLSRADAFVQADAHSDRLTRLVHVMEPFDLGLDTCDHMIAQRYLHLLRDGTAGRLESGGTPQSWCSAFTVAAALLLQCDSPYVEVRRYDETIASFRWW